MDKQQNKNSDLFFFTFTSHTILVENHHEECGSQNTHMFPAQIHQWSLSAPHAVETMYCISCGISKTVFSAPLLQDIAGRYPEINSEITLKKKSNVVWMLANFLGSLKICLISL